MKKKIRLISLITALMLLVLPCGQVFASSIEEQIEQAELAGQQLRNHKATALATLNDLNAQLDEVRATIEQLKSDIETKLQEIEQAETELVEARIKEETQYKEMKLRIKYMYENGNEEALSVLLSADSLADLVGKAEYVEQLSAYDKKLLENYEAARKEVEEKKAALEKEYAELQELEAQTEAQQKNVEALIQAQNEAIAVLSQQIGANDQTIANLKKKQEEQIAAAEAAAKAVVTNGTVGVATYGVPGLSNPVGTGILSHPCPDFKYVSSTFGYRAFDNAFHKGTDFAAPEGTPVYAAEAGTVIISGWSDTAGNWVVISHENGLVTKYMHLSALYVYEGQEVSRGENIGAVGTTGNSTGNHLHFQVEKDGAAVEPMAFL